MYMLHVTSKLLHELKDITITFFSDILTRNIVTEVIAWDDEENAYKPPCKKQQPMLTA